MPPELPGARPRLQLAQNVPNPARPSGATRIAFTLPKPGPVKRSRDIAPTMIAIPEVATLAPANAEIRYHLGAALAASGQGGAARDELRRALAGNERFPGRDDAEKILRELK